MAELLLSFEELLQIAKTLTPEHFRPQRIGYKRPKVCHELFSINKLHFTYDDLSLTYNRYEDGKFLKMHKILFAYILHVLWKSGTMPDEIARAYAKKHYMDFSEITHFKIA